MLKFWFCFHKRTLLRNGLLRRRLRVVYLRSSVVAGEGTVFRFLLREHSIFRKHVCQMPGVAPGFANAWPPGRDKIANVPPKWKPTESNVQRCYNSDEQTDTSENLLEFHSDKQPKPSLFLSSDTKGSSAN